MKYKRETIGHSQVNSVSLHNINSSSTEVLSELFECLGQSLSSQGLTSLSLSHFASGVDLSQETVDLIVSKTRNIKSLTIENMDFSDEALRWKLIDLCSKIVRQATSLENVTLKTFGSTTEEGLQILQGLRQAASIKLKSILLGNNMTWWTKESETPGLTTSNETASNLLAQLLKRQTSL